MSIFSLKVLFIDMPVKGLITKPFSKDFEYSTLKPVDNT